MKRLKTRIQAGKFFILLGLLSSMLIFFQNCAPSWKVAEESEAEVLASKMRSIDAEALPRLRESPDFVFEQKNGQIIKMVSPIFAEAGSIVISFRHLQEGTLAVFGSGVSDRLEVRYEGGKISARHRTDDLNESWIESTTLSPGGPAVIAASFGSFENDVSLLINGTPVFGPLLKAGQPTRLNYLEKQVMVSSSPDLLSSVVYSSALSLVDLNALSRAQGNEHGIEVAFDPSALVPRPIEELAPTPQFLAAKAVIDQYCLSCHQGGSTSGSLQDLTATQFLQRGWVQAGNPAGSKLYHRLQGAESGPGPRNMPLQGTLPASAVQAIRDWILSM